MLSNDSTREKKRRTVFLILNFLFIVCLFLIMLNRVQYGINFTDESWYVAEPFVVSQQWSIPFINNVTQAPGFTIPLALAYKLFCSFNGGTEGIFLFSRILYLCFALFVSWLTVFIVNKFAKNFQIPYVAVGFLFVASCPSTIFDINYNTIGVIYYPLILALVFVEYKDNSFKSFFWGCLAGILATRAIMGTPQIIVGVLIIFIFLCLQKKWMRVKGLLVGFVIVTMLILGYIIIFHGIDKLLTWFHMYLNQAYFAIESQTSLDRKIHYCFRLLKSAIPTIVLIYVFKFLIQKKNFKIVNKNISKSFHFQAFMEAVILLTVFISILYSISNGYDNDGEKFPFRTWFLPFIYYWFTYLRTKLQSKIVMVISFSYFVIYLFSSLTNIYGFVSRHYWLLVPIVLLLSLMWTNIQESGLKHFIKAKWYKAAIIAILITMCFFKLTNHYMRVYGDDRDISKLKTKITAGIWKGLYTTDERAENVVELEKYLKGITDKNDNILCLDWTSFAYLMVNGKLCSPTTLDFYTYYVNDPNPYYMYFHTQGKIPNKIIYIDFKRDQHLSIEDSAWKFNFLVNNCFSLDNEYSNKIFKVKAYSLIDQKRALKIVNSHVK